MCVHSAYTHNDEGCSLGLMLTEPRGCFDPCCVKTLCNVKLKDEEMRHFVKDFNKSFGRVVLEKSPLFMNFT